MDRVNVIDVRELKELENYEEEWNNLLEKCPGSVHTQSFAMIYSFFRHSMLPGKRWICLFAYKNSELIAVFPLITGRRIGVPGFYFQTFATPYDIFHTIRVDSLILPGNENVLESFIIYLRKSFRAFPKINIRGIPGFSSSMLYFNNEREYLVSYKMNAGEETFIPLQDNYQKFLSGLKPRLKSDINRRFRKLSAGNNVLFRFRDNQRTNQENLEIFKEIESCGWKGKKKTSIKTRSADSEFFHTATDKLHRKGWVHWNFLEVNDETIAAQLHVRINSTTILYKIAYKENYSQFAPGILLLYKSIEDCYNHGEKGEINFMNAQEWFDKWNGNKRALFNLTIMPRNSLISKLISIYLKAKYGGRFH